MISAAARERALNVALRVPPGHVVALIVELLAPAQRDLRLYAAALQIDLQRNDRKALLHDALLQLADLRLVHEQPLGPQRIGV